jgi:uncharacterized membrane protein
VVSFTYPALVPWLLLAICAALAGLAERVLARQGVKRAPARDGKWRARLPGVVLAAGVAGYAATFSLLLIAEFRTFGATAFDLGIFDQGTWLLSRGLAPFVTLRGLNLFGDHTSFVLLLVAPVYRLFEEPATLFVLASAAMALGAAPLYLLGRAWLGGHWLPLVAPVAFLLYPPLEYVSLARFHPESFAVPGLLWALYFGLRGNGLGFGLAAGLAAICKEDVALTLVGVGLYLAWRGERRLGLLGAAGALVWLVVCLGVLLPAFNPAGFAYLTLYAGGPGGGGPLATLARAAEPYRLEYLLLLLVPLGGLPLLSPAGLLALPQVAINLFSARSNTATIFYHYAAVVAPLLAFATLEALRRSGPRWRGPLALYALLCAIGSHLLFSPSPLSLGYLRGVNLIREPWSDVASLPSRYRPEPRDGLSRRALALIPANASVAATSVYAVQLAHRREVYQLPLPFENGTHEDGITPLWGTSPADQPEASVEYVLLDQRRSIWPARRAQIQRLTTQLRGDPRYGVVLEEDGLLLLRRLSG